MNKPLRLSVAIPVYNERESLSELLRRVGATLDGIAGGPHEIVIVDDGSTDGTADLLRAAADPRLVAVRLSRNFGHQCAITAALDHATGDAVVVMDGDLQDEPEIIPQLLDRFDEGYDIVYTVRAARHDSAFKQITARVYYRLLSRIANVPLVPDSGDFALVSRRAVDAIRSAGEHHRYLRGLRAWAGFRQCGVPVERPGRTAGTTKYSLRKMATLAGDGIVAFSTIPLRCALFAGGLILATTVLVLIYALLSALFWTPMSGIATLTTVVAFFAGLQLVAIGIMGEYLGRVLEETKHRPHYVVETIFRPAEHGGSQ